MEYAHGKVYMCSTPIIDGRDYYINIQMAGNINWIEFANQG